MHTGVIGGTSPSSVSLEELFENRRYLPSNFFDAVALPCMKEYHDGEINDPTLKIEK